MKTNEFVKKYGWDEAKAFLSFDSDVEIVYTASFFDDLKRLVKSHELVEYYGGLEKANHIICSAYRGSNYEIPKGHEELSIAIQDVESCL